ncbi:hypothetical protein J2W27_004007 [Variovorax boronicumulans]|nr:hypothetical protein [Variovorax boronicumulans]
MFIGVSAHALVPKLAWQYQPYPAMGIGNGLYATPAALCEAYSTKLKQMRQASNPSLSVTTAVTNINSSVNPGSCTVRVTYTPTESANESQNFSWVGNACPANSAPSGGSCACTAPYVEDPTHTSCVVAPSELEQFCRGHAAAKNPFDQKLTIGSTSATPQSSCYKPYPPFEGSDATRGCQSTLRDTIRVPRDGDPLLHDLSSTGIFTGATCEDAPATDSQPKGDPNPCPDGFPGTLNGSTVCVKREPNKGIEGVKDTEEKHSDGTSTTTKETTKCEGGTCTTKKETTQRDASGAIIGVPKVEEKKQPIGEKCNEDPGNKVCASVGMGDGEGGAGMTGNCLAGFTVKGEDPILNAMALEQYRRNCDFFEKKPEATDETRAYDAMLAKGKQGGDQTGDLPEGSKRDYTIGPSDFDYSSAIGSQQCFRDRNVSIWGRSIVIPLSVVCPWLDILGNILVVVASLLAARIVVRG